MRCLSTRFGRCVRKETGDRRQTLCLGLRSRYSPPVRPKIEQRIDSPHPFYPRCTLPVPPSLVGIGGQGVRSTQNNTDPQHLLKPGICRGHHSPPKSHRSTSLSPPSGDPFHDCMVPKTYRHVKTFQAMCPVTTQSAMIAPTTNAVTTPVLASARKFVHFISFPPCMETDQPASSLQPLADHPDPARHTPEHRSAHSGDGHRDQHFRNNPSHLPSLLFAVLRVPNPPSDGSTVGGQEQAHSVEHQDWIASSSSSTMYLSTFSIFAPSFRR